MKQSKDSHSITGLLAALHQNRKMLLAALFNIAFLCFVFYHVKIYTASHIDLSKYGNPQPFYDSAEIAAKTGIPLLSRSHIHPDNIREYERLELFSAQTDVDHLDGAFWNILALISEIRPTKRILSIRNYLLYLASVWLFSFVFSWYYKRPFVQVMLFVFSSMLVFLPQVGSIFHGDYITQGTVAIAPIFMATFLLFLCGIFSRSIQHLLLWAIFISIFAFFLRYLSVIHSANQSAMLLMLLIILPLIYLRFRPPRKIILGFLLAASIGALSFDGFIYGLRIYRDFRMEFSHPPPRNIDHATFSLVYIGIGSFENALGMDLSDHYVWQRSLIEHNAHLLDVSIREEEKPFIGGAPKADYLFFRLWTAYLVKYPLEYFTNRIQANAWIVARFALRDIYPELSSIERIFWCIAAVLSWPLIALVFWVFVHYRYPVESIVVLLAAYIPTVLMGVLFTPIRGTYAGLTVMLIAITLAVSCFSGILPWPGRIKRSIALHLVQTKVDGSVR